MKRLLFYLVAFCLLSSSLSINSVSALANEELRATGPTIASGWLHSCAIDTQGTVKCWGDSFARPNPWAVPGSGPFTQITAGAWHTCAVSPQGAVACWGSGHELTRTVPSGLGKVVQIEAGDHNTCAINTDHQLYCWGLNTFGETHVPSNESWLAVSPGTYHTCAINLLGQARCWGINTDGQADVPSDLGKVVQISAGERHTCALNDQGLVRCWGIKTGRSIVPGLGKVSQLIAGKSETCVISELGSVSCWGDDGRRGLGIERAIQVTVGISHICAVNDQSEVICWGSNEKGQSTVPNGFSALTSYDNLETVGTPEISGSSAVGGELSVNAGVWDEGVSFAYKWLRDGDEIPNATTSSYMVVPEDYSKKLSVRVVGAKPFFVSAERTSVETLVSKGIIMQAATPRIVGRVVVGSELSVDAGVWDDGVTFAYKWLRDGDEIPNATTSSYKVVPEDYSKKLSVRVVGAKPFFVSAERTSVETSVSAGLMSEVSVPVVVGSLVGASVLRVDTGVWDEGVTFVYQWLREDIPISGANKNTYTLADKDYFRKLSVEVLAIKEGYQSEITTTLGKIYRPRNFYKTSIPKVQGGSKVGQTLTVILGSWDSGTTFTYQWWRNGKPVAKANKSSYKLSSLDKGAKITVGVTAKKIGSLTVTKTSAAIVIR